MIEKMTSIYSNSNLMDFNKINPNQTLNNNLDMTVKEIIIYLVTNKKLLIIN